MTRLPIRSLFTVILFSTALAACALNPGQTTPAVPTHTTVPVTVEPLPSPTSTLSPDRPALSPTSVGRFTSTPSATPTLTPIPFQRTFKVVMKHSCGMSANGTSGTSFDGVVLCFEEPGFFEQQGNIDYFVLLVKHPDSEPSLSVYYYGLLREVIPTPTPTTTRTPSPTPTPGPSPTATFGPTPTRGGARAVSTPVIVRTITIDTKGFCGTPTSSVSFDRITLCFSTPPGQRGQGNMEYWTIAVTRDLTPTVKFGLLAWATPHP